MRKEIERSMMFSIQRKYRQDQVTQELVEQLRQFRLTHEYRQLNVEGVNWTYLCCGQGTETILLLPGAPGLCETAFQQILCLECSYRLLSVVYPPAITSIAGVVNGLQALLVSEKIDRVHVIGLSYGGAIAQYLLAQMPAIIDKLIFVCTGSPDRRTAERYRLLHFLLALLPSSWIHTLLLWAKASFLTGLTAQRPFWSTYYDYLIPFLTKADYLARIRVWIDFHCNADLLPIPQARAERKILIVEAELDRVFPLKKRHTLETHYPHAQVYLFPRATHMVAISDLEPFLALITRFLQQTSSAGQVNPI